MSTESANPPLLPVAPPVCTRGRGLAIAGLLLGLATLWGAVHTFIGVLGAFAALGQESYDDKVQMNAYYTSVAIDLAKWLVPGCIGLILVLVALTVFKNREPWFFVCGLCSAIALLPFLLPLSLPLIILLLMRRKEFFPVAPVAVP